MTDYPVSVPVPEIGRFAAGNTGVPYVTTLDGPREGPHAMIAALVHGNELCGAHALVSLLDGGFRPAHGRVTLAFVNVEAFDRFDPARPSESRYVDEDFNRVWDMEVLDGPRRSSELARARALRPIVDDVDLLLDIHSMQHATAPLALAGMLDKGVGLARAIGVPALVVKDQGHSAGRRMRDYRQFADPKAAAAAVLVECGQHWAADSVAVAREATWRFLAAHGYLSPAQAARFLPAAAPPAQKVIEVTAAVTIATTEFRFAAPYRGLEVIPETGTLLATDGDREILTPYPDCVLIMPSMRLVRGQTAVRLGRFVG